MAARKQTAQSTDENTEAPAGATADSGTGAGAEQVQEQMAEVRGKGYRGSVARLDGDGEGKPNSAYTHAQGGDT